MSIRNRISCALAKKRRGDNPRFLPYAVMAALGVGLSAGASSVAETMREWTPADSRNKQPLWVGAPR